MLQYREFDNPKDLCEFSNEDYSIEIVSIIFRDYKFILFYKD